MTADVPVAPSLPASRVPQVDRHPTGRYEGPGHLYSTRVGQLCAVASLGRILASAYLFFGSHLWLELAHGSVRAILAKATFWYAPPRTWVPSYGPSVRLGPQEPVATPNGSK